MKPEMWALITAICWGGGSLLEKRGVTLGNLAPVMGTAMRTAFSMVLLLVLSVPFWRQVPAAGTKSILLIALGGGVLAGGVGLICLYTGLKQGNLSTVLTLAFCFAPVVGAVLGYCFLHEKLSLPQVIGISLCIPGAGLTIYFKQH